MSGMRRMLTVVRKDGRQEEATVELTPPGRVRLNHRPHLARDLKATYLQPDPSSQQPTLSPILLHRELAKAAHKPTRSV